jgi:hypothetical protein
VDTKESAFILPFVEEIYLHLIQLLTDISFATLTVFLVFSSGVRGANPHSSFYGLLKYFGNGNAFTLISLSWTQWNKWHNSI